jgi:hypothetical protein
MGPARTHEEGDVITHETASRSGGVKISRAISIDGEPDRVAAGTQGMMLAIGLGFSPREATSVATAISEMAGKILAHATRGEIVLSALSHSIPRALTVTALGQGDGLTDASYATRDRSSTWARLRTGSAGFARPLDRFEIVSEVGPGLLATAANSLDASSTAAARAEDGPEPRAGRQPRGQPRA